VRNAVNLGWSEVPLRSAIQERMGGGIPVWLEKDANANTLGEMYYGAARNSRDFLYIAIGTGLGGGAVIDGRLLVGANAYATEVGHVSLDPSARECVCGLHGCPEIYIAGVGIMAGLREHAIAFPDSPLAKHPSPNTSLILQHAKAGDPLAHKIMDEARDWLIKTLAMYTTLLNPELIVIGGGMGLAARSYLIEGIEVVLKTRVLPATAEKLRVLEAGLTSSAVGAASLVWHALGT
jgi:glucokinase